MRGFIYAALSGTAFLAIAQVQSSAQTAPSDAAGLGTDEILVTAQRRSESLSKTPVAVAVVSGEELSKANIVSEQDLRMATPGLSVRTGLNTNNLNYSLRGQSQDPYSSTRPGVLPYINEVQVGGAGGSSAASSAFYDLDSIQVLKGPQGTLFGRSATGGAVLLTTRKPGEEINGYVSALLGDFGAMKFEGAAGGTLDKQGIVAIRVAGVYEERNGYQRNLFRNERIGDFSRKGVRGTLVLKSPDDAFKNETVYDYFDSDGSNISSVMTGLMPFTGTPPPYIPLSTLYGGSATPAAIAAGAATVQAFTGASLADSTAFYKSFFAGRENQGLAAQLAAQTARGPFITNYDGPNSFNSKNRILINTTTVELGNDLQLRNIFGLVRNTSINGTDADGTPFKISQGRAPDFITQRSRQISNELQLQGKAIDGRLEFVVGGYYSDERLTQKQDSAFFDILFGGGSQTYNYQISNKTTAGYGQATYDLNGAGLKLTVGGRYTSEKVTKEILPLDGSFGTPGINRVQNQTFNTFSWQLGLSNQFSPDFLGYIVTRRAYKAGGYNGTLPASGGLDSFAAERVTDVEAGIKYNGQLGAMPTRLNLAVYHNWIRNSQRSAFAFLATGPAGLTVNVPKGTVYGFELDGVIKPADWLSLGGTFNYTKASYSSTPTILLGAPVPYDQVTDTPEVSGSIFAELRAPVSGNIAASLRSDLYAQSKTLTSPLSRNNFGTVIGGYSLVNLRAGLEDETAGWSLTANLKNVFNRAYYSGGQATGEIYQINLLVPGQPRSWTIEARFKF